MGSESDVEVIRRGYAAFSAGDMATLNELFTEDAVWHVPGAGPLSGAKEGREGILSFFGELMSRSEGTLTVTLDDVVGGDHHTVALNRNQATRGSQTLQQNAVWSSNFAMHELARRGSTSTTRPVTTRSGRSHRGAPRSDTVRATPRAGRPLPSSLEGFHRQGPRGEPADDRVPVWTSASEMDTMAASSAVMGGGSSLGSRTRRQQATAAARSSTAERLVVAPARRSDRSTAAASGPASGWAARLSGPGAGRPPARRSRPMPQQRRRR